MSVSRQTNEYNDGGIGFRVVEVGEDHVQLEMGDKFTTKKVKLTLPEFQLLIYDMRTLAKHKRDANLRRKKRGTKVVQVVAR